MGKYRASEALAHSNWVTIAGGSWSPLSGRRVPGAVGWRRPDLQDVLQRDLSRGFPILRFRFDFSTYLMVSITEACSALFGCDVRGTGFALQLRRAWGFGLAVSGALMAGHHAPIARAAPARDQQWLGSRTAWAAAAGSTPGSSEPSPAPEPVPEDTVVASVSSDAGSESGLDEIVHRVVKGYAAPSGFCGV